ncbi:hypothetical protein BH09VER1_BH09VER1_55370 [soil metagenome]
MPLIAEETIQRVAEANDIVEVVQSYFPLRRAGTNWVAICPFHQEKSPSFHVSPQRQSFHCFGCGKGGSVLGFVMEYEHIDFPSSVRKLAQRAGIPIIEEEGSPEEDARHRLRKRLLAMHVEAAAWFHQHLLKSPSAQIARDYLKSRGLTGEIAKSWQLGFAPDSWDDLPNLLREKKFSVEEILQSGLTSSREEEGSRSANFYSRFRGRVMFPIRNDWGEVVAFSGRVLDPEAKGAKYVNSPETEIFKKGKVLYGLDKSKRALIAEKTAIVCEGQLDLISAFESGVQNVIAPQGTAFTTDQARLLNRFVETVILCFDSDRAGQEAVAKSLPALLDCGLDVRVARLPEGEDPDSLIRSQGPEAFREVVLRAANFFDHAMDLLSERGLLNDPAGKSNAARRLGPYVAMIKDQVLREATASKICSRMGIAEAAFRQHLKPPSPPSASTTADAVPVVESISLSEGIRQLCRFSIFSSEVREWLASQPYPTPAELGAGGEILGLILGSSLALEEPAARAVFLSTLSEAEQKTINSLDLDRTQNISLPQAQNFWFGLAAETLVNQREAAESQVNQSGITREDRNRLFLEITELGKQILDLQRRVNDL